MIQVHEVEGFYPEAENKLFELASEMRLNQVFVMIKPYSYIGMNFIYTIKF